MMKTAPRKRQARPFEIRSHGRGLLDIVRSRQATPFDIKSALSLCQHPPSRSLVTLVWGTQHASFANRANEPFSTLRTRKLHHSTVSTSQAGGDQAGDEQNLG